MENIKRQRKIAFIMILVSIVMISSGLVSSLIVGLKEDKQLTRKRMDEVKLEYEDYSTMISLFEEKRDGLYGSVFNNLTYETMFANNKVMFNEVSNYEAMVDEIKKNTNKMDKLCMDVYYPDSNVNSICNNYRTIFEQVNNYFVIDITEFNKNIDKYNTYVIGLDPNLVIKKYETKKKMIDFDDDGVIVGKDE